MPKVQITKDERGKLVGFGEKGERAYKRFLAAVKNLEYGEMLAFAYKIPRAPKFHRLHFVMLAALFEAQDQFADEYQFRKWSEVGAGHCDFVPGPTGRMVALAKSIDYESLDDVEFSEMHEAVKGFFRTTHATRFLWPHLSDAEGAEMVRVILDQFERE
ncbi:MAG: hypothetical protein V1784_08250 [bacterium]